MVLTTVTTTVLKTVEVTGVFVVVTDEGDEGGVAEAVTVTTAVL